MGDGIRRNGRRQRAAGVALLPGRPALPAQCVLQAPAPASGAGAGTNAFMARAGWKPYHTLPQYPCDRARVCCGCARCGDPRREAWVHETCQALSAARAVPCRSSAERRSFLQPAPRYSSPSFKRKKILHAGGFHVLKPDRQASSADHSENTGYGTVRHVLHRMRGPHQGFPAAAATSAHNGCLGLRRKPDHRSPAEVPYWAGVSRAPPASCQTD